MPESIKNFIESVGAGAFQIPFFAIVGGKPKLNFARITETLIQMAVIGLLVNYVTVREMKKEFELEMGYVKEQMLLMRKDLKEDINELSLQVQDMRRDLYQPIRITK
jgi:hypothetical protein